MNDSIRLQLVIGWRDNSTKTHLEFRAKDKTGTHVVSTVTYEFLRSPIGKNLHHFALPLLIYHS
jgi:hypothetical protein